MKQGDIVSVAIGGDFGKPRPALVVEADAVGGTGTIAVLLIRSTIGETSFLRLTVEPTQTNGLRRVSQIMIEKPMSVRRHRVGSRIGSVDAQTLLATRHLLAVFLGIA